MTREQVRARLCASVLGEGTTDRVGLESEWFPVGPGRAATSADHPAVRSLVGSAGPPPAGSSITYEPGGQLELSTPPLDLPGSIAGLRRDLSHVEAGLQASGIGLSTTSAEPPRRVERVVAGPRYAAMESYFDADNHWGRVMMRTTASLQINLDTSTGAEASRRWRRLHFLGPVLSAAFANSPLAGGRPTGWRSTRLAAWNEIDATRTVAAYDGSDDVVGAWVRYALDARVMMIWTSPQEAVALQAPLTFERWSEDGHELGWPTGEDLDYHLTTLFPPVRPRGHFEFRVIDALPEPWWPVAVAVTTALVYDAEAAALAEAACIPAADLWTEAYQDGMSNPVLRRAAERCFEAARPVLSGLGVHPDTIWAADAFMDRYIAAGRCPADDALDEVAADPLQEARWT